MQHKQDYKVFKAIFNAVKKSFVNRSPTWHADPENSSIRIISKEEMDRLRDTEVQNIFKTQHIFVQDQFVPDTAFDENGLRTLAELDKPVTIHGWFLNIIFLATC